MSLELPGSIRSYIAAGACLLCLGFAAPLWAQEPYPDEAPQPTEEAYGGNSYLAGTPAEEAALDTLLRYELVKLREQATEILKSNPQSYAGHYLLGFSLHNSEGDLPRAKFHLKKAKELFTAKYSANASMESPWGWYERILMELVQVNAEMDAYQEQVETLDDYVKLGRALSGQEPPNILAAYAWPLMKMEREAEARAKLKQVSQYQDEQTRSTYLNTLGALEMEFGHPKASYNAFKSLIEDVRSNGWSQSATYLRNLGEASAGIGQFDEAERLYSEATRYFDTFTYSNPWYDLTFLYLSQARFPEAVDALKKTHAWRFAVQPFLAQQTWAQDQHVTAELLLQLGETEKGLAIAANIVSRPDRQGGDSIQADQKEAGTLLLYRSLLTAEAARLQESLTWTNGWDWWSAILKRRELLAKARLAGVRIQALAATHDRIAASLRPYYAPRTIVVSDWHRPDLVAIYGAGVTSEALQEIYQKPPESFEWEKSTLDVIQAEVAFSVGKSALAIDTLRAAIPELGESRAVLRARAEARLAGILFAEDRFDEAMEVGTRVFDTAPAMFRHLGISVPVSVTAESGAMSQEVARALTKSPRFHSDSRGFVIKVSQSDSRLTAAMSTPQGTLLSEVSVPLQEKDRERSASEELLAQFQQKAFAPRLDLSQADINNLDGSTLSESRRSDRAKKAIGRPVKPTEP